MALNKVDYTVEKKDDGYYILRNDNADKMVRHVEGYHKNSKDAHQKERSGSRSAQGSSVKGPNNS